MYFDKTNLHIIKKYNINLETGLDSVETDSIYCYLIKSYIIDKSKLK